MSSNKADLVIAGVTKNEKREQSLSFSNGYFSASQVVIVKKIAISLEQQLKKLENPYHKIMLQLGLKQVRLVNTMQKEIPIGILKSFLILFARLMIMGLLQLRL